jgi:hypothetical protein
MFLRDGAARKEKRLEYLNRDPKSVLLIDCNAVSESLNPLNTVLVSPMAAGAAAGAAAPAAAAPDTTCLAIKALVARVREEVAASGVVHVPRALEHLRTDAAAEGFGTDSAGLYAFIQRRALEERSLERETREAGLGGLLRRTAAASPALRSKASTLEAAARRPFRDPAADLGDRGAEGLLAVRVRETNAKLFGGAPRA